MENKVEEKKITVKVQEQTENSCKLEIRNIPIGCGNIITHSLRRMINLSVPSFSVSGIRIQGLKHEFANIEGIQETTIQLIRNIKEIIFTMNKDNCDISWTKGTIEGSTGLITAGDIKFDGNVTVLNKEHIICNLSKDIKIEIFITAGKGFVRKEENFNRFNHLFDTDNGEVLFLDASYTKVNKMESDLEIELHSKYSDIEKLHLNLHFFQGTDPIDLVNYSFSVLSELFASLAVDRTFINKLNLIEEQPEIIEAKEQGTTVNTTKTPIENLDLTNRSLKCLQQCNIIFIEDLANFTRKSISEIKNLGITSMEEIESLMKKYEVTFLDEE